MNAGATLGGRFQLVAPIGSGGVGTVWRAQDLRLGQPVALKVLHPHLRSDAVVAERFRREAQICRSIQDPAIARAFELFELEEALFFSMELLDGGTLKDALLAQGPLPWTEVLRIARACLGGLSAAHRAGVVHRDFKSQNVALCRTGEVKILDFGFARVASAAGLTTRSLVLCTPDYAAPELVSGKAVDGRADLYALGVVLFEALTGKLPFRAATPFELLQQHLSAAPPRVRSLRRDVPPELDAMVHRLLSKNPEDRFATCEAALAALELSPHVPADLALPKPASVCPSCGEPREPSWALCPACGATDRGPAAGDKMVVLMRAPPGSAKDVRAVLESVGAVPAPLLEAASPRVVSGLPRVLLKGVGELLARLVRERCQARELQVEIRSFEENNSDLLHRSNTPSYLFAVGLVLPWAAVSVAALTAYIGMELWRHSALWLALPAIPALAGPALGYLLLKRAHLFLPALARISAEVKSAAIPSSLVERYRQALVRVRTPSLRGTLRRLFERALVVHGAVAQASKSAKLLLDGTGVDALRLAARGMALAESAQKSADLLAKAGEPELFEQIQALQARAQREPERAAELQAEIRTREAALARVAEMEQRNIAITQQLLAVASALELASVHALAAGMPVAAGQTLELRLKNLVDESEAAADGARELVNG